MSIPYTQGSAIGMSEQLHTADTFEKLFRDNYPRLCHFAQQFLNDDDAAKDIVQEVFVTYWNLKDQLHAEQTPAMGFLYASVRNACLNRLRRQKLEHSYLNTREVDPSEDPVALNTMIRSEVMAEIHQLITTLPDSCQRIFRMGYLEGLKNPQIAEELGISINTVKTQKKRGLQFLKMRLNPELFALVSALLIR